MLQPIVAIAVFALVFAPLELLAPARRPNGLSWRRYTTDLLHAVIGGYAIRVGAAATIAMTVSAFGPLLDASVLPLWLQAACVLLLSDAGIWIAHRMFHASPWLWQFHKIHHSSTHLDWLAAYRVHPVDQILNATFMTCPVLLLGFAPAAILIYAAVFQWHSILLHSNVKLSFGPLERVIVSPRYHRWHHANAVEAFDKNFAAQLAIWDRIGGTMHCPDGEPSAFGVDDAPEENFLTHILTPFRGAHERPDPAV